jgi:F-type H+-transporting ATPase subunit b
MRVGFNLAIAAALAAMLLLTASPVLAQEAQPPAAEHTAPAGNHAEPAGEHAAAAGHEEGSPIVGMIARLFNFTILAGTLVYFLRTPIATYLRDRGTQIRGDLVKAADMRTSATAQLAAIDKKMAVLPAELDALRKTGAEELTAEESRMRRAAESERTRLLDQARREIDAQLKVAQRQLLAHTADLAVAIASKRVKATITAADQARLVDRYLGQLGRAPGTEGRVTA